LGLPFRTRFKSSRPYTAVRSRHERCGLVLVAQQALLALV
jgi:hypothetical protein